MWYGVDTTDAVNVLVRRISPAAATNRTTHRQAWILVTILTYAIPASYYLFYIGYKSGKNKVPPTGKWLFTNRCSEPYGILLTTKHKKRSKCCPCVSTQYATRHNVGHAKNFQTCYDLTRFRFLPSPIVPLRYIIKKIQWDWVRWSNGPRNSSASISTRHSGYLSLKMFEEWYWNEVEHHRAWTTSTPLSVVLHPLTDVEGCCVTSWQTAPRRITKKIY